MRLPPDIEYFIHQRLPKMHGWCPPDKAASIAVDILNHQPQVCVEIGVYSGRSMLAAALALKENGTGIIYGIDPWTPEASVEGFAPEDANHKWWGTLDYSPILQQCLDHIAMLHVDDFVSLIRKTNRDALPEITAIAPLDWLHIDGNHASELARYDVEHYVPLVRPGGTIWFDDVDWSTTAQAQALMDEYATVEVYIGNCAKYRRR